MAGVPPKFTSPQNWRALALVRDAPVFEVHIKLSTHLPAHLPIHGRLFSPHVTRVFRLCLVDPHGHRLQGRGHHRRRGQQRHGQHL